MNDSIFTSYQYCKKIALGHYENFPVGSVLIPKPMRPAIWAIYAFARIADDFSDEGYPSLKDFQNESEWRAAIDAQKPERLEKLANWRTYLKQCYDAVIPAKAGIQLHPRDPGLRQDDNIFLALQDTIARHQIPYQLLNDLLIAFERDVTERRKNTWEDVIDYCHYSANPIGRLILWIFGYQNSKLFELSDAICTGLQLANFWQDIAVDLEKDRIYVPLHHPGLPDENTSFSSTSENDHAHITERLQQLGKLTWPFFEKGFELPFLVQGRLAWELKLTWLSGVKILEKSCANLKRLGLERPKIETSDKFSLVMRSFFAYNERALEKYKILFK